MAASDTPARTPGAPSGGAAAAPSSQGIAQYLREVRTELKKAEWPTREELIRLTEIVLMLIVIVAVYCGALDGLMSMITTRLFSR